jgi:hypothetical protein
MNSVTTTTFPVSDVRRATTPLSEVPYKQAIDALFHEQPEFTFSEVLGKKPPPVAVRKAPHGRVEACTRYHGRLLADVRFHPLVGALHFAFLDHRPLTLSPDMIWLLICQGVANHINAHAERLRSRLVHHEGKQTIEVRRDDFVKGSPENPWPDVFHDFSTQIRNHVGPAIDRFLPDFTTTGPVERAACEVVLLDAMQSYFEYSLITVCGIPAITLEGTPKDWQTLADRAQDFSDLDLDWWLTPLSSLLARCSEAARGSVDLPFWRSLYKYEDSSGGPHITGWITAFFPYLKNADTGRASVRNPGFRETSGGLIYNPPRLTIGYLPSGLAVAPFRWDYLLTSIDMEFLGGFVGVAQDAKTLTLRPEIGWAVREAPAAH